MRYLVAAVGRARPGPEQDLFDSYRRRLAGSLQVREVEEKRPLAPAQRIVREGALLLAEIPADAFVVALDERGRELDSETLAGVLGRARDEGRATAVFLIGGADGHDEAVRRRADLVLALGRLTWPHLLVRALVAEQVYRCECIWAHHPYHRGRPPSGGSPEQ